ncbi:MAG: ThuA domain-containing protein [Phycisphaerales bacterium]|jgi:type 1 glutamine amidotransferase|nr:ThuA domain-containing protein [Phycisphaerales bacterium]MDP6986422.1 ThuA domain-containing protein [Phycisphaerales bacterium]
MLSGLIVAGLLQTSPLPGVLVFSRTGGYRHASIEQGQELIQSLGQGRWRVVLTEDPSVFTPERLAGFEVVVFLQTTGDVLDDAGEAAVEQYVRGGGGLVGIHAAADGERDWPFFGREILGGAWFKSHPAIQEAAIVVDDRYHPSTRHLDRTWPRTDEWYDYAQSPRGGVHVIASLDESSYEGGQMGSDHPIVWCAAVGAGAAFYTGLGHTQESYAEPAFQRHIEGGIKWAMDDGWIGLEHWKHRGGWLDVGGAVADGGVLRVDPGDGMLVNGERGRAGDLVTAGEFGDCELHVEFMIPEGSNSGVYLQGRYEIQILDSAGKEAPGAGDCGGIYERWEESRSPRGFEGVPPRVNAAAKPGLWQTYDIVFRPPRFDAEGRKTQSAMFESVRHNGVLIHEHVELSGPTRGGWGAEAAEGPVRFQGDHGPVAYRDMRLRRLASP